VEKVVFLSESEDPLELDDVLDDVQLLHVDSREDLAHTLLDYQDIVLLVVEPAENHDGLEALVRSIERCFPMLHIAVLARRHAPNGTSASDSAETAEERSNQSFLIPRSSSLGEMQRQLREYTTSITDRNRRRHNRFNWPLSGMLTLPGEEPVTLKVRSISAGGAYLESGGEVPPTGSVGTLTLYFQNFRVETECEVLDNRGGASNLPPGFGVRFHNLSEPVGEFIDGVVNDGLMEILLDDTAEPSVPSLDEEDLVLSFGDEIELLSESD
jgi:hypothetical protein